MTNRAGRYKAEGLETEFEPGSRGRVLLNRLGIRSVREMARREEETARRKSNDRLRRAARIPVRSICVKRLSYGSADRVV